MLLDRRARERGILDSSAVERLLRTATSSSSDSQDADAVWQLFNLELWYRTFIDGDGVQTLPMPTAAPARAAAEPARRLSAS